MPLNIENPSILILNCGLDCYNSSKDNFDIFFIQEPVFVEQIKKRLEQVDVDIILVNKNIVQKLQDQLIKKKRMALVLNVKAEALKKIARCTKTTCLDSIELIDKKWRKIKLLIYPIEEIGFQGNNPLTDFRGSRLLGLQHLHAFTMSDKRADEVFKVAAGEKTWYFYAATGINISGKVIDFIEDGLCDKYFFDSTHPEVDILQFTSKFYCELFTGFNAFWVKGNYTDFMKVNTCLEEFMKKEAESIFKSTFK